MAYPRSIVVEGPIGVGKTTLALHLARRLRMEPVLEQAENNPFLARFYDHPRQFALPAQLSFLLQRMDLLRNLRQPDIFRPATWVADFLLAKDRLFAELNLTPEELELYLRIHELLELEQPAPELVIYLQAEVDVLRRRIDRRGVAYEQEMEPAYLERVCTLYVKFFHDYSDSTLLIVNVADYDLADDSRALDALLQHIHTLGPGRHYFNPAGG